MGLEAVPLSREQTLHIALGMGKALLKTVRKPPGWRTLFPASVIRTDIMIFMFCYADGYYFRR